MLRTFSGTTLRTISATRSRSSATRRRTTGTGRLAFGMTLRTRQGERRKRTRHLIELGGLVVKAGMIVDLTGDDRAMIYGVLLWVADKLRNDQGGASERRTVALTCIVCAPLIRTATRTP